MALSMDPSDYKIYGNWYYNAAVNSLKYNPKIKNNLKHCIIKVSL